MRNVFYKKLTLLGLAISFDMLMCSNAWAQDDNKCLSSSLDENACLKKGDLLGSLELTTPSSPLFALSGSTPENVIVPKPGDDLLVTFLPQAVNSLGEENTAIALEINPGLLIMPKYLAVKELERGGDLAVAKFLTQFNLTGSLQRVSSDTENYTRYGFGGSYIYDTKSAFINNENYRGCISGFESSAIITADEALELFTGIQSILDTNGVEPRVVLIEKLEAPKATQLEMHNALRDAGMASEKIPKAIEKLQSLRTRFLDTDASKKFYSGVKECGEVYSKWNRDVYGLGLAYYHTDRNLDPSTDGVVESPITDSDLVGMDDLNNDGFGLWASAAFAANWFGEGQLIFSGRYLENQIRDRTVDGETVTENVDVTSAGARFTHQFSGSKEKTKKVVRGFIEAGYYEEEFSTINDKFFQAGIGAELQLSKDLFFQVIVGDTFGSEIERSTYLSGQVKWSFSTSGVE